MLVSSLHQIDTSHVQSTWLLLEVLPGVVSGLFLAVLGVVELGPSHQKLSNEPTNLSKTGLIPDTQADRHDLKPKPGFQPHDQERLPEADGLMGREMRNRCF